MARAVSLVESRGHIRDERHTRRRQCGILSQQSLEDDGTVSRVGIDAVEPGKQIGTVCRRGLAERQRGAGKETAGGRRQRNPVSEFVKEKAGGGYQRDHSRRGGAECQSSIGGASG